jgi:hypothetical protein
MLAEMQNAMPLNFAADFPAMQPGWRIDYGLRF